MRTIKRVFWFTIMTKEDFYGSNFFLPHFSLVYASPPGTYISDMFKFIKKKKNLVFSILHTFSLFINRKVLFPSLSLSLSYEYDAPSHLASFFVVFFLLIALTHSQISLHRSLSLPLTLSWLFTVMSSRCFALSFGLFPHC